MVFTANLYVLTQLHVHLSWLVPHLYDLWSVNKWEWELVWSNRNRDKTVTLYFLHVVSINAWTHCLCSGVFSPRYEALPVYVIVWTFRISNTISVTNICDVCTNIYSSCKLIWFWLICFSCSVCLIYHFLY